MAKPHARSANLATVSDDRGVGFGLLVILGYSLLLASFLLVRPTTPERIALIANLARSVGPLAVIAAGFVLTVGPWRASLRRGGARSPLGFGERAPSVLALGCICWACGHLIWTFYEQVLHRPVPLGSWSDLCYLATYPLLLVGILGLPRQTLSLATRVRLVFDGLLIAITLATYSWYFLLGPNLLRSDQPIGVKAITAAYPIFDLAVLICLLWIGLNPKNPAIRASTRLLSFGLAIIVAADTAFQFLVLRDSYATGTVLDACWPLGYMLIGLGAIGAQRELWRAAERDEPVGTPAPMGTPLLPFEDHPPLWRALLPYLSLPIIGGLFAYAWFTAAEAILLRGIVVASGAVLVVVIVHQIVMLVESWQVARDLDSAYRATLGRMEQVDQLQQLAATDPLTGLLNRRALNAVLDEALARATALGTHCAVVLLDLDRFKALNDTYGHQAGDEALRDLAAILRTRQRGGARAGRWGGEEFLLVLPATDEIAALARAEELRAAVAAHVCLGAEGIRFTCSLGVAVYPQDASERESLIAAADRALYTAKSLGRNQIFSAADRAVATLMGDAGAGASRGAETLAETIEALAALVQSRDGYGGGHTEEVARLSLEVALALGCDAVEAHRIEMVGRLRDVGKVMIPDAVLQQSGPLGAEEWALMRLHPATGAAIIEHAPTLRFLAPLVRSHHECWDGGGYPDGLAGAAIPLGARIVAVAEAYGALTSHRPYRVARTPAEALAEIRRCAGGQFDPAAVAALERVVGGASAPDDGERRRSKSVGRFRVGV